MGGKILGIGRKRQGTKWGEKQKWGERGAAVWEEWEEREEEGGVVGGGKREERGERREQRIKK